jgi:hypothetical protein
MSRRRSLFTPERRMKINQVSEMLLPYRSVSCIVSKNPVTILIGSV